MKTKIITLALLLVSAVTFAETMRVAILEPVDRDNKVSYGVKLILRSNLAKAVTNTAGYEAYDRSDMDAIMGEQNFQRTGLVSEEQIKRLGEMTGAKYILVAEAAVIDASNMFITAKVLDVESARTIMTDNLMMGMDAAKIQEGCTTLAMKLFRSYSTDENDAERPVYSTNRSKSKTNNKILLVHNSKAVRKYENKKEFSYGDLEMDKKEAFAFMSQRCPEAFKKAVRAQREIDAGWGMFGITCAGGFFLYLPCWCAGVKHLDQAVEYFNKTYKGEE